MPNHNMDHYRHTLTHILMQALRRLYGEQTIPGVGPAIEDGFYHDFESPHAVTNDDLVEIQKEMKKIITENQKVISQVMPIPEALKWLTDKGYKYTHELALELQSQGSESLSFYGQGEFLNMCRGGHIESTGDINPDGFVLTKIAGAYWKGSEKNPMLQRIYGIAFETKEELSEYMTRLEEAKKRDHRKLGEELDLFTFSELVGAGLPLWTPRGTLLRNLLDEYVWSLRKACGYERVEIPHITRKDLYEKSGHWEKFKDELFRITTREGHEFAMKPMNCPHHTQIYARKAWSYRELPQRYANSTTCYRDEQTGELSGLSRVRSFTQDDAHVFCRLSQAKEEFIKIWDIVQTFYSVFGFVLRVRISKHDPATPEKYLGGEEKWKFAEDMLTEIALEKKADSFEGIGEAAFYGPKLDFMAKDAIGREWQVATIQLDLNMPERFDLTCINEKAEKERIVMIHAAIMGSIERFCSIFIEHTAGMFPVWLAPVQIEIISVGSDHTEYCHKLASEFVEQGLRVHVNDDNETVGNKIRKSEKMKIPYMLVIGDREMSSPELAVRKRGEKDVVNIAREEFITSVKEKIENKSMEL